MRFCSVIVSFVIVFTLKIKGGKCEVSPIPFDQSNQTGQQVVVKVGGNEAVCICTANYVPVCGWDGKTYGNACALSCTRKANPYVFGLCKGECPCCKEPFYNDPLELIEETGFFGWDLMKHSVDSPNPMIFSSGSQPQHTIPDAESEKSEIDTAPHSHNFCDIKPAYPPNCVCPFIYHPVCGSDGNTYSNACQLGCYQKNNPCVKVACEGKCPCCACPETSPF